MAEPRDQGDQSIEQKAPETESTNLKEAARDGTEEAAKKAVFDAQRRTTGRYDSGLTPVFGPRPEIVDDSAKVDEKAEKELPSVSETLGKVYDMLTDSDKAAKALSDLPAEAVVAQAGPKGGDKTDEAQVDAGAKKDEAAEKGGVTAKNEQGMPTEISYPDGDKGVVTYGADGVTPTKVQFNDSKFEYDEKSQTWKGYDSNGKLAETIKGTLEVGTDGKIVITEDTGLKQTLTTDARVTKEYPDNSKVVIGADGQVASVTRANGQEVEFKYDDQGKLTEFKDENNDTWKKDGDVWRRYHKGNDPEAVKQLGEDLRQAGIGKGYPPDLNNPEEVRLTRNKIDAADNLSPQEKSILKANLDTAARNAQQGQNNEYFTGDFEVSADGDVTRKQKGLNDHLYVDEKGEKQTRSTEPYTEVTRRDGTIVRTEADKSSVETKTSQHDGGKRADSKVDAYGQLSQVKGQDGVVYDRKDDGHWERHDSKGQKIEPDLRDVKISANGDIQATEARVTSVRRPDGKTSTFQYEDGKLVGAKDAHGTTYEKSGNGWTARDSRGQKLDPQPSDVDVTPNGDIVGTYGDQYKTVEHKNGTSEVHHGNDHVLRDKNGRVTEIQKGSTTYHLEYDKRGQLERMVEHPSNPSSSTFESKVWTRKGNEWTKTTHTENGKEITSSVRDEKPGKIELTRDDELMFTNPEDNKRIKIADTNI